jgi:hypothetical protein
MPTRGIIEYIGVVGVIPALGKRPASGLEVLLHCKGQDTRSTRSVNCVDSKHSTNLN